MLAGTLAGTPAGTLAARGCKAVLAVGLAAAVTLMPAAAQAAPSDDVPGIQQWVLDMLDVPAAWNVTQGKGVTVAVIDSGVDPYVADLAGNVITGPNLTGLSTPESNPDWGQHGTWMASIIAGDGDGGIIGVAPEAKIFSVRVIPDKDDPGYRKYESEPESRIQQSLATGIMDAVRRGAQVISMSIGYSSPSAVVRAALQYAFLHGAVLVASAGNSGQDDERHDPGYAPVSFPADYPGVLGVAAVNSSGAAAGFSSNNLSVQVAAPGVNVPAQGRDNLYWMVDGTSPACALVAGVAALIKSKYPGLSPALVDEALTTTAHNGPGEGYNPGTGFGTVDAAAALTAAGRLAKSHAAGSQVAPSGRFGGGPAAVPAAPVAPRGVGQLVLFAMLALLSLALGAAASAWFTVMRRPPEGAHAAHPRPAGAAPGPGHAAGGYAPGFGPPYPPYPPYPQGTGNAAPGTEHGARDDPW
ncbi:S8 family serine peptidase [Trebonia sp.]|uniref:S8 family peptidase n=1 Tax=Trebonia sp. TaxID=2767075 RepID=UPI00261A1E9C|nr:S8 family serine peptidase [Trebonia sp.]